MARLLTPTMAATIALSAVVHVVSIVRAGTAPRRAPHIRPETPMEVAMEVDTQRELPTPAPEPPRDEETERPTATPTRSSVEPHAPAPAPAQAGHVLTAPDDPRAAGGGVDFTMVEGNSDRYAGGVTSSMGTSSRAVHDARNASGGSPSGTGSAAAPAGAATVPDESQPARPSAHDWSCSHLFPAEADAEGVHVAVVTIMVRVAADGSPQSIDVLADPGHGFGRAARACAQGQRYLAAKDHAGKPTAGRTAPFSVRFTR